MKRTSLVLGNTMGNTRLTDFQQVFEALRSDIPSNLFETGTTYVSHYDNVDNFDVNLCK